jgi:hypothetical protein
MREQCAWNILILCVRSATRLTQKAKLVGTCALRWMRVADKKAYAFQPALINLLQN